MRPEGMPFKEFVIMRQTIQLRVINALKLWVELSVDFIGMSTGGVCVFSVVISGCL